MKSSKVYIEDEVLFLPVIENGVRALGQLYNCRTGTYVGDNLFTTLGEDYVNTIPGGKTKYELSHIKNDSDKTKAIGISGNLELELLAGAIKVEGSARYDAKDSCLKNAVTMSCDYYSEKYQVELKPNVKCVLDHDVEKRIKDHNATHVVKSVILGGEMTAKISISDTQSRKSEDIDGSFLGKVVYGCVSATVKAKLKWFDSDDATNFEKRITIYSNPSRNMQPTTIEEMFEAVEGFAGVIENENQFLSWDRSVKGVPIKFTLVPIKEYLECSVEKLYVQLKSDIFERFKTLLSKIIEYLSHDYVIRQLIDSDQTILFLLKDNKSKLSLDAINYTEALQKTVNKIYEKAVALFKDYRCGKADVQSMLEMINEAEESLISFDVTKRNRELFESGMDELNKMHYRDICSNENIKIFTNKMELDNWLSMFGCKILLQTNGEEQGVMRKFSELSEDLSKLQFGVAVSAPSISTNFALSIKINEEVKEYSSNINYILTVLRNVVTRGHGVEFNFFNIYASTKGLCLPIHDIKEVNKAVDVLSTYPNVFIADSLLTLQARLSNSTSAWQFFAPIEAIETAFSAVSSMAWLCSTFSDVDWITGSCELDCLAAPMLLVFKKKSLEVICFDNLDLICFKNYWNGKGVDISLLNLSSCSHTFYGDRLQYVNKLLKIFPGTLSPEPKLWKSLNLSPNPFIVEIIQLLQTIESYDNALFNQNLYSMIVRLAPDVCVTDMRKVKDNKDETEKLRSQLERWLKIRNPMMADIYNILDSMDCYVQTVECANALKEAIVKLTQCSDCPISLSRTYEEWKNSEVKFMLSKVEDVLKEILRGERDVAIKLVRNLIKSLKNPEPEVGNEILQDIFTIICEELNHGIDQKEIIELIAKNKYHEAAGKISRLKYGLQMKNLYEELNEVTKINDVGRWSRGFIDTDLFRKKEIWTNHKFCYLITANIQTKSFLREIASKFNNTLPDFIPQNLKTEIEKTCCNVTVIDKIENLQDFIRQLRRVKTSGYVPPNFRHEVQQSISRNEELEEQLQDADALRYWNKEGKHFDEFNMSVINDILTKLSESTKDQANVSGYIHLSPDVKPTPNDITAFTDKIHITHRIQSIFGDTLTVITNKDFVEISKLIAVPSFDNDSINGYGVVLLPYLVQKIKMLGCDVLTAESLNQMRKNYAFDSANEKVSFNDDDDDDDDDDYEGINSSQSSNTPLSRLDCLTGLFSVADIVVAREIVRNLSQFSISMPLVIQNIDANNKAEFKFLWPVFTGVQIKWEQAEGSIADNYLFSSHFRLILAVRLGTPTEIGKSSILNQIIVSRSTSNMFASKSSPGCDYGQPLSLDGSVEFIWLTEETTDISLWNDTLRPYYCGGKDRPVIILANLHGDAVKHKNTLQLFKQFTPSYIVFFNPSEKVPMKQLRKDYAEFCEIVGLDGEDSKIIHAVVASNRRQNKDSYIDTHNLTSDNTLNKVRKLIKCAIDSSSETTCHGVANLPPNFAKLESVESPHSIKLIELIKHHGCRKIRQALKLQFYNHQQTSAEGLRIWETTPLLQSVMKLFSNILMLPKNERLKALQHLETEISILSNKASEVIRSSIIKTKNTLQGIASQPGQASSAENLRTIIMDLQNELNSVTLGLEHLHRELARIYTINLSSETNDISSFTSTAPARYADMLLDGHAIELLDGDAGELHPIWLLNIFRQVSLKRPNLKIFVVTILGIQSSGKSTLLNALFACKFAVSYGRCTRGIFARFLFLDDSIKKDFGIEADAILIIDTEGLAAPEMVNDKNHMKKDRQMATFAMGISGLTIINVLGEGDNSLTEILQIAIIAMARLREVNMSPDILIVQHHHTERNKSKATIANDSFRTSLENAIAMTKKKHMEIGIRDSECLRQISNSLQKDELLKSFSPYKDGSTCNSDPSKQYQEDVLKLYKSIFNICHESGHIIEFRKWFELLNAFWSSVSTENFAVTFKNLKEVEHHVAIVEFTNKAKDAISWIFRKHCYKIEDYIKKQIGQKHNRKVILDAVEKYVRKLPQTCLNDDLEPNISQCEGCTESEKAMRNLLRYIENNNLEDKREVENTMFEYQRSLQLTKISELTQFYDATLHQSGTCEEYLLLINNTIKKKLRVRQSYTKQEIDEIETQLWIELIGLASNRQLHKAVSEAIRYDLDHMFGITNPDIVKYYDRDQPWESADAFTKWKIRQKGLEPSQIIDLQNAADSIFDVVDKKFELQYKFSYHNNMLNYIMHILKGVFANFNKLYTSELIPKFEAKFSAYVLKQFRKRMQLLEEKWKKTNDPFVILKDKEDEYRSIIRTRLEHGFSYHGHGTIASKSVLNSIQEKSLKYATDCRINHILGIYWLTSYQSIRLKCFKHLIHVIKNDDPTSAVDYFKRPQQHFTEWFRTQIDKLNTADIAKNAFKETFDSEKQHFVQSIKNNSLDKNEIVRIITQQLRSNKIGGIESDFERCTPENLEHFVSGLLSRLENVDSGTEFENVVLSEPADDEAVQKRVGCTRCCKHCGALCMGGYKHESDTGDTSMHHTIHQPVGLTGISYRGTGVLCTSSCDTESDSNVWYVGENKTTWGAIKEKDWLYTQNCDTLFRELMIRFFIELNHKIASVHNKLPATNIPWERIPTFDDILAGLESNRRIPTFDDILAGLESNRILRLRISQYRNLM